MDKMVTFEIDDKLDAMVERYAKKYGMKKRFVIIYALEKYLNDEVLKNGN